MRKARATPLIADVHMAKAHFSKLPEDGRRTALLNFKNAAAANGFLPKRLVLCTLHHRLSVRLALSSFQGAVICAAAIVVESNDCVPGIDAQRFSENCSGWDYGRDRSIGSPHKTDSGLAVAVEPHDLADALTNPIPL